ncbi:MAG: FGGY family carbohydrate kinase, partial [Caldilineaceae bacterium]|nr:FGGY family carbohydrate kinase [Caldilineaceae bacterium]
MPQLIGAIDSGTTSTRFMLFDQTGAVVGFEQQEHEQIFPRSGWVEHDPLEIWQRTQAVIRATLAKCDVRPGQIAAIGITNQRETAVVWDRRTGLPVCNAIVWQDTRTDRICRRLEEAGHAPTFQKKAGLPLATYFSGPKFRWILENVDGAQARSETGDLICGTVDSWLIWQLTGGDRVHVTDPT